MESEQNGLLHPATFASEAAGAPSTEEIVRGKAWLDEFSDLNKEIMDLAEQLGSKCGIDVDAVEDWLTVDEGIKQPEGGTLSIRDATIDLVLPEFAQEGEDGDGWERRTTTLRRRGLM